MDAARSADKAKIDQIVGEAFVKAAHVILTSRIHEPSPRGHQQQQPARPASKSWVRYACPRARAPPARHRASQHVAARARRA